jgi:hypothetical protein
MASRRDKVRPDVNVHSNAVADSLSVGDLYAGTPSRRPVASFCTGADSYKFSTTGSAATQLGDAGGIAHSGFINDGTVAPNWIIFNQGRIRRSRQRPAVLAFSVLRRIARFRMAGMRRCHRRDCPPGLPSTGVTS